MLALFLTVFDLILLFAHSDFECVNLENAIFLCTEEKFICDPNQDCTVSCLGYRPCYNSSFYCPVHHICEVRAPSFKDIYHFARLDKAMAHSNIFGAVSTVLNVQMDSDRAFTQGYILCPTGGICTIRSLRLANETISTDVFSFAVIHAQASRLLNITIKGVDSPLLNTKIFCPSPETLTETSCVIDVSNGKALFNSTEIYVNEYTNLYISAHHGICDHGTCIHQVMVYKQNRNDESKELCECTLISETTDKWNCINPSLNTQCSIPHITPHVPIVTVGNTDVPETIQNESLNMILLVEVAVAIICVSGVILVIWSIKTSSTKHKTHVSLESKDSHIGLPPPLDDIESDVNASVDLSHVDDDKDRQIKTGICLSKVQKKEYLMMADKEPDEKVDNILDNESESGDSLLSYDLLRGSVAGSENDNSNARKNRVTTLDAMKQDKIALGIITTPRTYLSDI
eukprot:250975_1